MNIVHIITRSDTVGGAQKYILETSKRFIKDGHQVTVIAGGQGIFSNLVENINAEYIEISSIKREVSLVDDIRSIFKIKKLINSLQPDVVLVHSVKAGLLSRLALITTNFKVLFIAHGWSHIRNSNYLNSKVYILIEKILSGLCDGVICISNADFYFAINNIRINKNKLRLIYSGVIEHVEYNKKLKNNMVFNILTVTRFQEPKDFDTLLKALFNVKEYLWTLNILGDGPLMNEYITKVNDLGLNDKINFLGFRTELNEYYYNCDVVLLISKSEGLPLSLIEGMSYKKPLIASNVGGVSELIDDGWNGYLIPSGDYNYLSCCFKRVFDLDKRDISILGENSYNKFLKNFHFEDTIKKLYENIV